MNYNCEYFYKFLSYVSIKDLRTKFKFERS